MERLGIGKDIFVTSGRITEFGGHVSDPDFGDVYEYILLGDTPLKKVILPHSLKRHISSKIDQNLYFTKYRGALVLTDIGEGQDGKVASTLQFAISKKSIFLLIVGLLCAFLSLQAGLYPHAEIFLVLALAILVFVAFHFYNGNSFYFLSKKVNENAALLKRQLASQP